MNGLERAKIREMITAAEVEQKAYMLKFFNTKDLTAELQRRNDHLSDIIKQIYEAIENSRDSITDLEDAEAFIKAIAAVLHGIV